jgi:hypothetical protein
MLEIKNFYIIIATFLMNYIANAQVGECPLSDCSNWTVVSDSVFTKTFEWDDPLHTSPPTLFVNCIFEQGAWMGGVDSVYFYKCVFKNKAVALGRSMDQNWQGTSNLVFDSCDFFDSKTMSFVTGRNPENPNLMTHENIIIRNCFFKNWGADFPGNNLYHAIYSKGSDILIENNIFHNVAGGSAISIRNSGIVRNNKIFRSGYGMAGITYWNQFPASGSKELMIEGNVIVEPEYSNVLQKEHKNAKGKVKASIWIDSHEKPEEYFLKKITLRNNSIIIYDNGVEGSNDYDAINIGKIFGDVETEIFVYDNFIIDLRTKKSRGINETLPGIIRNDYNSQNTIIRISN